MLERAVSLALKIHANQPKRGRGLAVIVHLMEACANLSRLGVDDQEILSAGILHDALEDGASPATIATEIEQHCSIRTLNLVRALTKPEGASKEDRAKFMFDQILADPIVCLIKMADRLSNICTLDKMTWQTGKKTDYLREAAMICGVAKQHLKSPDVPHFESMRTLHGLLTVEINFQAMLIS